MHYIRAVGRWAAVWATLFAAGFCLTLFPNSRVEKLGGLLAVLGFMWFMFALPLMLLLARDRAAAIEEQRRWPNAQPPVSPKLSLRERWRRFQQRQKARSAEARGVDGVDDLWRRARLDPRDPYRKQHALVAEYRAAGKPFVATMLVRSLFICKECDLSDTEGYMHFENPREPLPPGYDPSDSSQWGRPKGVFADVSRSSMHQMLAHGMTGSDYVAFLASLRRETKSPPLN